LTETTCPHCLKTFKLPKPHGTNPRWVGKSPKKSAVKILRALRGLGAFSEGTAVRRRDVAKWLKGECERTGEDFQKVQNLSSRASELVTLGLAELVRGTVTETVGGIVKESPIPRWYITEAGLEYLRKGQQAMLPEAATA
jgi:hypothetical protein